VTSIKTLPGDWPTAAQTAAFMKQDLGAKRRAQARRRAVLADCVKARQPALPPPPPPQTRERVDLDALAKEIADAKQEFEDLQKALREAVGDQLIALDTFAKAYTTQLASAMKDLDAYVADARTISGPIQELWKLQRARLDALQWAGIVDIAIQMGLMAATTMAADEKALLARRYPPVRPPVMAPELEAQIARVEAAAARAEGVVGAEAAVTAGADAETAGARAEAALSKAETTVVTEAEAAAGRARDALAGGEAVIGEPTSVSQAIENIAAGYGDKLGDAAKARLTALLDPANVKVAANAEEWAEIVGRYPSMANKSAANVGGFFDPATGRVFLPPGASPTAIQHEVLHAASNPIFAAKVGGGLDEALTEHFATEFGDIFGSTSKSAYIDAGYKNIAQRLEALVGHDTVTAAYFGDSRASQAAFNRIRDAVNAKAGNASAWDQLVEYSKLAEPRNGTAGISRRQFVDSFLATLK